MSRVSINPQGHISVSITGPSEQLAHLRTLLGIGERMLACREQGALYGYVTNIEFEAMNYLLSFFAKDAQKTANDESMAAIEADRGRKK